MLGVTFAELAAIAIGVAALALASAAFVRTGRTLSGERRSDDSAVRIATSDPVPAERPARRPATTKHVRKRLPRRTKRATLRPKRLSAMYLAWAKKRRMRATALEDGVSRHVFSIGGFGVHRILAPEAGLHVLEAAEGGDADGRRYTARVRVVPEPSAEPRSPERSLAAALVALADPASARTSIVRRYREGAAPLVRDAVAGWRTGRIDLVLQGDFDLLR